MGASESVAARLTDHDKRFAELAGGEALPGRLQPSTEWTKVVKRRNKPVYKLPANLLPKSTNQDSSDT